MTVDELKAEVLRAISLLQKGGRDEAAEIIAHVVSHGPPTGELWKSIGRLAGQVGEVELALECASRFAATRPIQLSRLLHSWQEMIGLGRQAAVESEISRFADQIGDHPSVLHVRGQLAAQRGEFELAREFYLRAIQDEGCRQAAWFSLTMITDMSGQPAWVDEMRQLASRGSLGGASGTARLLYALGKAYSDNGDIARAMEFYQQGANMRREELQYNADQLERFALDLARDFKAKAMARLRKPDYRHNKAILVNGMPRSGTTLIEQILTAHSAVADGGEVNLAKSALIPTVDYTYRGAAAVDAGPLDDPWGDIARNYERMLGERFQTKQRVVDKSLTQSHIMGLIAHAIPNCPIVWMRRDRADVAISCFRNYFTSPLPWCWDLADIGHFTAIEDYLFDHWQAVLGDVVLPVQYEELVKAPEAKISVIQKFAGLTEEDLSRFFEKSRHVRTASLQQVRSPVHAKAVGQATPYGPWLNAFWRSYEETATRLRS